MAGIGRHALRGMRYTPEERERFHRDLRADGEETLRNAWKSPGVLDAHANCEICAGIRGVGGEG